MYSQDCFICQKHRGEIDLPVQAIYEDDLIAVWHLFMPETERVYLGYLFIETRRHSKGLSDLTSSEAAALGQMAARLAGALEQTLNAEHVYIFSIGHHTEHVHWHIVARHPGTPREYWGARVDDWPDAPQGDATAVNALGARTRAYLEESE